MAEDKKAMVLSNADMKKFLKSKMAAFEEALPITVKKFLTPERIVKIVGMAMSKNPTLMKCTSMSILDSVMESVQLGLEPGGPLQQAHLVPFYNKNIGAYECKLIVGYGGYITLARNTGELSNVVANLVYEKDEFEPPDLASDKRPVHKPYMKGDRGEWYCVYCIATFKDGTHQLNFMTKDDIMKLKKRSRARDNGPWKTDEGEMAKKSVVRNARKLWPMSTEKMGPMARAAELENMAESGEPFIDVDFVEPDTATRTQELEAKLAEQPEAPPADPKKKEAPQEAKKEPEAKKETVDEETGEVIDAEYVQEFPESDMKCPKLADLGQLSMDHKMTEKEWYAMTKKAGIDKDEQLPDEKCLWKLQELINLWIADKAAKTPPAEKKEVKVREKADKMIVGYLRQRAKECALEKDEDILMAMKGSTGYVKEAVKVLEDLTTIEIKAFTEHLDSRPRG